MSDSQAGDAQAAAAGRDLVAQIAAWAKQGLSAPAKVLGQAQGFVEWAHYPYPDAIDLVSGWRFYYHCHPRSQRLAKEHGHFHVFVPTQEVFEAHAEMASASPGFSHLIGISVDAKGLPLRLFTTNRWVTGETWQAAAALKRQLAKPDLHRAEPQDVARWLENILILFNAEIAALIDARDRRLDVVRLADGTPRFEDHRLRIPSQARIDLARRLG